MNKKFWKIYGWKKIKYFFLSKNVHGNLSIPRPLQKNVQARSGYGSIDLIESGSGSETLVAMFFSVREIHEMPPSVSACGHSAPVLKEFLAYLTKLKTSNPGKKIVIVTYR